MKYFFSVAVFVFFASMPTLAEINASAFNLSESKEALTGNDISAVDALIARNIDVNMRDENGDTLLIYTLNNNNDLSIAKQLILAGADVNAPSTETGMPPMLIATSMADMLQNQARKLYADNRTNITEQALQTFMISQMEKAQNMLQMLIDAGANVNQETPFGTPLMNASQNEWNESIIKKLLENGAKVNATDRLGRTALFYAAAFDCNKIISQLMAAGADVSVKDIDGRTYMEAKPQDFLTQ